MEEFEIYFVLCTGYYCPVGSSQPLSCSLGQYCGTNELSSPTGNCSTGYFCNGTASVPNPRECDMGYYCPEGTTVQIPCSPGTFSSKSFDIHGLKNLSLYKKRDVEFLQSVIIFAFFYQSSDRTGNTNDSFCMLCTAGKYCQDYGLALPNGDCYAGYYCPEGQDVPQPTNYACSPGHFCEVGSWNETGCPSGMYQPHWARSNCDICPAGSYCKAFGKFSQEYFFMESFVNFNPFIKNNYLALLNNIYRTCEFYPNQNDYLGR